MFRASGRLDVFAILIGLLLSGIACTLQGDPISPTPMPSPTPAPRPTAETPAAVGGWYVAAQAEEPVRIRADLTAGEVGALHRALIQRYPQIRVEWRRDADATILQETTSEARAQAAHWDIYIGDSGPSLKTARLALRWTPPEARSVPAPLIDPEGAWYALAATVHVIQYNTEQVPPTSVPASYHALRHPGYFGRLAIEDLNLTWLKGLVEIHGREGASDLIRGLAQQAVTFRRDARTLVVFVTAGDDTVAINARMDMVEREKRAGGKSGWIAPDPVIVQPLAMVVSASSDRPNGARLVANYLLSQDAQAVLATHGRAPARNDVDTEPQSLLRGLRPHVTLPAEGQAERQLVALWQELWSRR